VTPRTLEDFSNFDLEMGDTNNVRVFLLDLQRRLNQVQRGLDTRHAERHLPDGTDPLGSGTAADGTVWTADGSGGAAWEEIPAAVLAFTPLAVPYTSTAWDGDSKSGANDGVLDLSAVFGVPAGVKAVLVFVSLTGTAATYSMTLGPDSSHAAMTVEVQVANHAVADNGIIPCDANGDIYASFYLTTAVTLKILGYWGP
jgi:hypothetical protein